MYVRAPCSRAASRMSASGAIRPSADCAALTATSAVPECTDSAIRSSGTARTLRSPRTWKGVTTELKSASAVRTSAPGGSEAAISPLYTATEAPAATRRSGTPTSRANDERAASTSANMSAGCPAATDSTAARIAATVRAGSSPVLAVFR